MAEVRGMRELEARLAAIGRTQGMMRLLGLRAIREQKLLVHRRTGNLGRSIHLGMVTERSARTIAGAHYAAAVEFGTRPHEITPKAAKALRWAQGAAGGPFARLSGAPRANVPRSALIFAMRVHHPGSRAYPFMVPGARRAVEQGGLKDIVIDVWNAAA